MLTYDMEDAVSNFRCWVWGGWGGGGGFEGVGGRGLRGLGGGGLRGLGWLVQRWVK